MSEKNKKVFGGSISMGPMNPGIQKPSTPKPAMGPLKSNPSGNSMPRETKNVKQPSNVTKKQ